MYKKFNFKTLHLNHFKSKNIKTQSWRANQNKKHLVSKGNHFPAVLQTDLQFLPIWCCQSFCRCGCHIFEMIDISYCHVTFHMRWTRPINSHDTNVIPVRSPLSRPGPGQTAGKTAKSWRSCWARVNEDIRTFYTCGDSSCFNLMLLTQPTQGRIL